MTALDEAEAAAAAQDMPQRADEPVPVPEPEPERWQITPLIGRLGIIRLLDVSETKAKRWRGESIKAIAAGLHTSQHLPAPDRVVEQRPLWRPITIVTWALANRHPLRVADLILPEETEIWSQEDIAKHFGVSIDTVRDRWRFLYTNAIKNKRKPPDKALPKEDFNIEGVLFWRPETVKTWGEQQGKLDEDQNPNPRHHLRWVSPRQLQPQTDEVQRRIDAGELWDRSAIAEFFGVSHNTVKVWLSKHCAGKDFPKADGPSTRRGKETWTPAIVIAWGEAPEDDAGSRRIVGGEVVKAKGGRPVGSTKDKIASRAGGRKSARAASRATRTDDLEQQAA